MTDQEAKNESFCYGCLSSDRRLTVLSENTDLFVYLLGRTCVTECTHIPLCWECSAILRNTRRFQQRIRRAQDLMQQTLYQQQTLQTLSGDNIKQHSSLDKKIFEPDHYDLCIEHTDTLTDTNMADVKIKIELEELSHEESLYEEVQLKQEDPRSPSTSNRNYMVTYSNTDRTHDVRLKYENIYYSDIDIEAGLDVKQECSAQDTNIEHQLNKHEGNIIKKGIDSDDCKSNVSDGRFSERELKSSLNATPRKKPNLSDDNETKLEEMIDVMNPEHVVETRLWTYSKIKPYECNIKNTFPFSSQLERPLNTDTGSVKHLSCKMCDKRFNQKCDLKSHLRTHGDGKPYSCEICDKKFTVYNNLKRHSRIHTGVKHFSCELCDKKFTDYSNLKRHSIIHTGEKLYSCKLCKKKFSQHSHLKDHIRIHTGEKLFSCELCDKKFTHHSNLKSHSRIHTGEKLIKYSCELCDKTFSQRGHLKDHLKIHTGEKLYSCEICNKKFTYHSNLKRHSRIHTGQKLFSCELCDKKFSQNSHLKDHLKIHTGEKLYNCELCDKKFTHNSTLKVHSRIHTGEKLFSCELCDRKFSQYSHLKSHFKIHTGEKLYNCDVCCKRFTEKSHLTRHLKTHNSEKPHTQTS